VINRIRLMTVSDSTREKIRNYNAEKMENC